jgi:hypothetical protein
LWNRREPGETIAHAARCQAVLKMEMVMRNRIAAIALLTACFAAPSVATAQTVGVGVPMITVNEARDIAMMNGTVAIRKIEFDDGQWKVEGRDFQGRRIEIRIDPHTGAIAELERFD